jgi:hypothetical protein
MKNIPTFESFINESANVTIPKLSDIDHTRVVKWMSANIDSKHSIKMSGSNCVIDTSKLSKTELSDLMDYLRSQEYIKESFLNEGDMTNHYDGFVVLDQKAQETYKFKYIKGTNNVKVENTAIEKLMKSTHQSRANFSVHGFVRKGEWAKSDVPEFEG